MWLRGEKPEEKTDAETATASAAQTQGMSPTDRAMHDNMEAIKQLEEWQSMMEGQ